MNCPFPLGLSPNKRVNIQWPMNWDEILIHYDRFEDLYLIPRDLIRLLVSFYVLGTLDGDVLRPFGLCPNLPIRRKRTVLNMDSATGLNTPARVERFLMLARRPFGPCSPWAAMLKLRSRLHVGSGPWPTGWWRSESDRKPELCSIFSTSGEPSYETTGSLITGELNTGCGVVSSDILRETTQNQRNIPPCRWQPAAVALCDTECVTSENRELGQSWSCAQCFDLSVTWRDGVTWRVDPRLHSTLICSTSRLASRHIYGP